MGGKRENKEGDLNSAHLLSRVLGYKRRNDIEEGKITDVRVYLGWAALQCKNFNPIGSFGFAQTFTHPRWCPRW
jgi:hypothetical protein